MGDWFPRDCREQFQGIEFLRWIAFIPIVLVFVGLVVSHFRGIEGGTVALLFGLFAAFLVLMCFIFRCPACRGGLAMKLRPRFCPHCGSKLRDPGAKEYWRDIDGMDPYQEDRSLPDPKKAVRIIEDTADRFRFRSKSNAVLGGCILLAGIGLLGLICCTVTVTCRRNSESAVTGHIERVLLGVSLSSTVIHDIKSVEIQESSDQDQPGYRIAVRTPLKIVPLTQGFYDEAQPQLKMANDINEFIKNTTKVQAIFTQPPSPLAWMAAAFLLLVGFGLGIQRPVECVLDRTTRTFQILRPRLGGRRVLEYPLEAIDQFGIVKIPYPGYTLNQRLTFLDHPTRPSSSSVELEIDGGLHYAHTVGMRLQTGAMVRLNDTNWKRRKEQALVNKLEKMRRSIMRTPFPTADPQAMRDSKRCVLCGLDCSQEARFQDQDGRYYHQTCYTQQRASGELQISS